MCIQMQTCIGQGNQILCVYTFDKFVRILVIWNICFKPAMHTTAKHMMEEFVSNQNCSTVWSIQTAFVSGIVYQLN